MWWIICQWEYYLHQGNLQYLTEQHSYLKGLVKIFVNYIDENGTARTDINQ